jgi:hypothetical protein
LVNVVSFPFKFSRGVATGLGVGVEGFGVERRQTLPMDAPYDEHRTVKNQLDPMASAHMKFKQEFQPVSLRGNAVALSRGTIELQKLAEMQRGAG